MTPASCLPVTPGENILDLCAAPGGKATALGAMLNGSGLLVANDISSSRTRALLRNIELFGIANAFVTNETPAHLKDRFPEFFHKILLDAPCSGEGMFRKEDALARDWTPEKSDELSVLQKELILQAADMLRPGGQLLYSTCTFAPNEDEGVVSYLLENRPDMKLMELPAYEGFAPGVPAWGNDDPALSRCVRLFPHKMQGEGHFMALFRKEGRTDLIGQFVLCKTQSRTPVNGWNFSFRKSDSKHSAASHSTGTVSKHEKTKFTTFRRSPVISVALPSFETDYISEISRKIVSNRPNHLALALRKDDTDGIISLSVNDQRLTRYLKGETLNIEQGEAAHTKGWHLLCVRRLPSRFRQAGRSIHFKNKYPAGWRV